MRCLECGDVVLPRAVGRGGNQPGFCSDECRRIRKRKTLAEWIARNGDRKKAADAIGRKRRKELQPDYFKEYYAQRKDQRRREANEWYHANADRALAHRKEYVAANRDKARNWGRKSANTRRAITKRVFVEVVDPRVVFERDKGMCGICMTPVDPTTPWEVDHIVPISKGGVHSYPNVQLSHRRCNRSKAARVA